MPVCIESLLAISVILRSAAVHFKYRYPSVTMSLYEWLILILYRGAGFVAVCCLHQIKQRDSKKQVRQ